LPGEHKDGGLLEKFQGAYKRDVLFPAPEFPGGLSDSGGITLETYMD